MHALVLIMSPFHHNPAANGSRFFSEAAHSDRRVALLFFQDFADGFNSVPVARGGRDAEMFLDDGVGIRLTEPPDAQGKSAGDGDDPDLPLGAGGVLNRKRRFRAGRFLQNTHESAHVLSSLTSWSSEEKPNKTEVVSILSGYTFTGEVASQIAPPNPASGSAGSRSSEFRSSQSDEFWGPPLAYQGGSFASCAARGVLLRFRP